MQMSKGYLKNVAFGGGSKLICIHLLNGLMYILGASVKLAEFMCIHKLYKGWSAHQVRGYFWKITEDLKVLGVHDEKDDCAHRMVHLLHLRLCPKGLD